MTKTSQAASVPGSVAAEQGTLKRSIQMRMMLPAPVAGLADIHVRVAASMKPLVLGQIVGVIYAVKEKEGELPNGEKKISLLAVGEFEATNYDTGEVFESTGAYLPSYYLETVKAAFEGNSGVTSVVCAVEVSLEPTGKSIPTTYMLKNLIKRQANSPLNQLKLALQESGRLKGLPAPIQPEDHPATALLSAADEDLAAEAAEREAERERERQLAEGNGD